MKEYELKVCYCGQEWVGGNSKYCPVGHAYQFTTKTLVEKPEETNLEKHDRRRREDWSAPLDM